MSKISLREVKLINWYGFINENIPLSENMTLILSLIHISEPTRRS